MNENTKQKRTFGEWLEDNGEKIIVGATVLGLVGLNVIYGKHCYNVNETYKETMATVNEALINRINTLECKECIKTVVTEFTGE